MAEPQSQSEPVTIKLPEKEPKIEELSDNEEVEILLEEDDSLSDEDESLGQQKLKAPASSKKTSRRKSKSKSKTKKKETSEQPKAPKAPVYTAAEQSILAIASKKQKEINFQEKSKYGLEKKKVMNKLVKIVTDRKEMEDYLARSVANDYTTIPIYVTPEKWEMVKLHGTDAAYYLMQDIRDDLSDYIHKTYGDHCHIRLTESRNEQMRPYRQSILSPKKLTKKVSHPIYTLWVYFRPDGGRFLKDRRAPKPKKKHHRRKSSKKEKTPKPDDEKQDPTKEVKDLDARLAQLSAEQAKTPAPQKEETPVKAPAPVDNYYFYDQNSPQLLTTPQKIQVPITSQAVAVAH